MDGNKATQSIWEVTWQLRSKAFQEYSVSAIKDLSYKWKIYSIASSRAVRQLVRVHKFGGKRGSQAAWQSGSWAEYIRFGS